MQSVYVDQYGEEDPNLRRGRPLYLSKPRSDRHAQRQAGMAMKLERRS